MVGSSPWAPGLWSCAWSLTVGEGWAKPQCGQLSGGRPWTPVGMNLPQSTHGAALARLMPPHSAHSMGSLLRRCRMNWLPVMVKPWSSPLSAMQTTCISRMYEVCEVPERKETIMAMPAAAMSRAMPETILALSGIGGGFGRFGFASEVKVFLSCCVVIGGMSLVSAGPTPAEGRAGGRRRLREAEAEGRWGGPHWRAGRAG